VKRIRVCATILGLLACAAVANAQQLKLVDANGNPVTDAQFIAIAEGNKIVQLPPAGADGTVDLSSLAGLENITNKTIEVVVYRCDQDPKTRVYELLPGATAPENKEHCKSYKGGAIFWDGSHWAIRKGADPGSPVRFAVPWETPASTGGGEGPSPFGAWAAFGMGPWKALDLQHECVGVSGCSTSDVGFSVEAGAGGSIGPFDFGIGVHHLANVSTTVTGTSTTTTGGTGTFTSVEKWHVTGFEGTARLNILEWEAWPDHPIIFGVQGGPMPFDIKGTSSFSSPTGSGFGGFSYGGVAGWYGAHVEVGICPHLAGTFDYKHADLRHTFSPGDKLTENINAFDFGLKISISPKAWRALIEAGKAAHGK